MEVSGQLHGPSDLPPWERARGAHWIGGWVDPRAGLDAVLVLLLHTCVTLTEIDMLLSHELMFLLFSSQHVSARIGHYQMILRNTQLVTD
jgi:hypothetical protein